jgi:branched-chain amino acid transport system substrate-binding protein
MTVQQSDQVRGQGRFGRARWRYLIAAGGMSALLLAVSSSGSAFASGKALHGTFSVVDIDPLSGQLSVYGLAGEQAVKAAASVLNQHGGVLGRRVTVKEVDDGGSPSEAASNLEQLLSSGAKPDMVLPGALGTEGVATVPILCQAGVFSIGSPNETSLNNPAKYPCFFSTAVPEVVPANALAAYAKANGWKKVAVLTSTDAYGTSVAAAVNPAITAAGLKLVSATFDDTQINFTPILQQLQAQNPQVLIFDGQGPVVPLILQARQTLGWNVPVVGDLGVAATPAVTTTLLGTPSLDGVKVQIYTDMQYVPPAQQTSAFKDFRSAMLKLGPINQPLAVYTSHYDAVMVGAAAAEQAGSTNASAMEKALTHLKQPKSPLWLQLTHYVYTSKNHFPAGTSSDFTVAVPTALFNGQIGKS